MPLPSTTSTERASSAPRPVELRLLPARSGSLGLEALGERALVRVAACALLLATAHLLTAFVRRTRSLVPEELLSLFDMSQERSLNSWLSVSLLLLLGGSICVLARALRERLLYVVGSFFLFLSLDDQTMLHERVGALCRSPLRDSGTYPWLIAVAPLFALGGLLAFAPLWRLTADRRDLRRRLVLGFACLALALPLEWIESRIAALDLRWNGVGLGQLTIPIEESLELLGPALLLACVAGLLERALQRGSRFSV
ncbi:MAG: hypothetical protein JNM84_11015 [Planctomycetes bacterium]|nr:hypothetical protein [Planctomycetota bacterium]